MFRFLGSLVFAGWVLAANAAEPLAHQQLVAALRQGGYVLYIRHTSTDFSRNDAKMASFEDYASPFCRTVETAMLAFGKTEKSHDVRGGPVSADDPNRYEPLRKLLSAAPEKGVNNVISSHGNPYYAVFGPPYLAEGEIAVIRPGGVVRFETVARIRLVDWEFLPR